MRRAAGFTLLELLIGMTLLGLILALLFGGFRLALHSWDAVETRQQRTTDEHVTLALVRRLIGSVQPLRLRHQPQQPLTFSGQPDKLVLVAPLAESIGLRVVEIAIVPRQAAGSTSLQLVLREGPLRYGHGQLADMLTETHSRILFDKLQSAEFSFFGGRGPNTSPRWHPDWADTDQFPALVRMQLTTGDGDTFDLVAATSVSSDRAARIRITAGPQ